MQTYKSLTLSDHQKFFIDKMVKNKSYGVFMRPGTGKTITVLETLRHLKKEDPLLSVLVLAPLIVMRNVWQQEIDHWQYPFSYYVLDGKDKYNPPPGRDIYIASIDLFTYDHKTDPKRHSNVQNLMETVQPTVMVVDESSKFRHLSSVRTKRILQELYNLKVKNRKIVDAIPKYERIYLLSGTPQPNKVSNLFSQAFMLDGGKTLGRSLSRFRTKYPDEDLTSRTSKKVWKKLEPICATAQSKFDHGEILYRNVYCEMEPHEQLIFNAIENSDDGEEIKIKGDKLKIKEKARLQYMNQASGGVIYVGQGGRVKFSEAKLFRALRFIESLNGESALLACNYDHEIYYLTHLLRKFDLKYCCLTGHTPHHARADIIKSWNWETKLWQVLICNPAAMGHGLNLQFGGSTIIWFSAPRMGDYELYDQFNARLNRRGQTKQVIVHHLVCKNTFDERFFAAIRRKKSVADEFIDYLKQGKNNGN